MLMNFVRVEKEDCLKISVSNAKGVVMATTHFKISDNLSYEEMIEVAQDNYKEVISDGVCGIDFSYCLAIGEKKEIDLKRAKQILWDFSDLLKSKKTSEWIEWSFELKDTNIIDMKELKKLILFIDSDQVTAITRMLENLHIKHNIPFID